MATRLERTRFGFIVSTVVSPGKRKRHPRGGVLVPHGDREALRAEIVRQAAVAREQLGVDPE